MKTKSLIFTVLSVFTLNSFSQTLYVPSGTAGVGSSTVAGKIGIGTGLSAPTSILDIGGTGNLLRLRAGNSFSGTTSNQILFSFNGTNQYTHAIKSRHYSGGAVGNALDFYIWNYGVDGVTTIGSQMVMTLNGGNLGIGCEPGSVTQKIYKADLPQFELASQRSRLNIFIGPESFQTTSPLTTKRGDVVFRNLGESHNMLFWMPDNNNDGNSYIGFADDMHNIWMSIRNNKTVHIDGTLSVIGSVGIGTTNTSGYKLAVAGEMIAEKVVVKLKSNWPDYVFDQDHHLKSLSDIESFIYENGHLEGVPSASEIKENGVDVAEMNAILLKKVEEITLLMIEQNKKIQTLQTEIEALKK